MIRTFAWCGMKRSTSSGSQPAFPIAESAEAASVRGPVSWAGVDPMPPRLAAVLADPDGPPVPLDDVVPGEPEHVGKEAAR